MGLFRPYERTTTKSDKPTVLTPKAAKPARQKTVQNSSEPKASEATAAERVSTDGRKNAPTPTRAQAQAARMEALHPTLSKREAKKKARQASRTQSQENWDRMERSPERELVRNFVDSRWTVAEFVLPAMLVFLAGTMATMTMPAVTPYVTFVLWGYLLAVIFNIVIMWRRFKRILAQRHPNAPTRGLLMYLINRSMMIRRFRMPRPKISRGDDF